MGKLGTGPWLTQGPETHINAVRKILPTPQVEGRVHGVADADVPARPVLVGWGVRHSYPGGGQALGSQALGIGTLGTMPVARLPLHRTGVGPGISSVQNVAFVTRFRTAFA